MMHIVFAHTQGFSYQIVDLKFLVVTAKRLTSHFSLKGVKSNVPIDPNQSVINEL